MEEKLRQQAIQRHLVGEKPKSIYQDLNRSKKWFFKWLKRYQTGVVDWYVDRPKKPHNSPKRIDATDRQRIIETRKRLEQESRGQYGVSAIKWELSKSNQPFPSDRTISRVIQQAGLVKKNRLRSQGR